uniref:Myosin light chain 3, skeletal muscle isoform n=1 Tax=Phallusia mammillata TaxID=59560 RepID=A0A6F9DM56_9ASCI|nr:myosin light chain 3, skeletal muscle isoform [Phallusia mammillata]
MFSDIKEAFEVFSQTPDMEIGYDQVGSMFRSLNLNPTEEDVLKALGNPSKEDMGAKKLKYDEFLPVYSQLLKDYVEGTFDDMLEGLRVFDKEGNGTVMGAEIRHVLRTLGDKMDASEISGVMDGQEDMNGSIAIEVFCKYLIEGKKEEK